LAFIYKQVLELQEPEIHLQVPLGGGLLVLRALALNGTLTTTNIIISI